MADEPEIAVVTGAARGIGAAVAVRLAQRGQRVLLVDACADQPGVPYAMPVRDELEAVALACAAAGAEPWGVLVADVRHAGFAALVARQLDGRPATSAVAAAGVMVGEAAWNTSEEVWDTIIGVSLHGTRRLAEATIPGMITAGHGRFVGVASAAALRAMPKLAAYSAAKSAVVGYVRALAADLAGTGVAANVICPGSTRGTMLHATAIVYDLPGQETFSEQHLLGRLLEPDEIAAAVEWLCTGGASAMTGAVIPVDGGLAS